MSDLNNLLIKAAKEGDEKQVRLLLIRGADATYNDSDALQWAARLGYDHIVKVLVISGADPHANNDNAINWAQIGHDEAKKKYEYYIGIEDDEGENASYWSDKRARYSVILTALSEVGVYYTHFGDYKVKIDGNNVLIFKNVYGEDHDAANVDYNDYGGYRKTPDISVVAAKVFIGNSPKNGIDGYLAEYDGNSVLVKLQPASANKYLYIGDSIREFETPYEIMKFISIMGNNSVIYPYAVDEKGNYYLLTADVVIKNVPAQYTEQPYEYYYNTSYITGGRGRSTMVPSGYFKGITKYWIGEDGTDVDQDGDNEYYLTYHPNAAADYDRIRRNFNNVNQYIEMNGRKRLLTKQEYVQILEEFGRMKGFKSMHSKLITID